MSRVVLGPLHVKTVVLTGGAVITALTSKQFTSPHGGPGTVIEATKNLKDLDLANR
ncbi:uncharacterized protein BO66DRAFT_394720 [Aspergillus aculeatinus CBS 121060]|uniref:Uncharacterized protein n=1 Tax=Aspergillus aculeatinus CBS 121060 TaxID=1448322 RepID=A0ACD1GYI7_9EURO|nr:hypothetical protein BO66DRAFT_394720 [Aspergillus aculeatinus CBS 121060]RAH66416.1 hypothetical protein BO66DRAFT_394720 [Aspergillus aculeatinus CBS 121060]